MTELTTTNATPTLDVQRLILEQDRQIYINTRYQLEARMRAVTNLINKNILPEDAKAPVLDELTKIEAWIAEYDDMIAALTPKNGNK